MRPDIPEVKFGELLFRFAIMRGMAVRPTRGYADKAGEGGDIDEGFDPLHAGQSLWRCFVPKVKTLTRPVPARAPASGQGRPCWKCLRGRVWAAVAG